MTERRDPEELKRRIDELEAGPLPPWPPTVENVARFLRINYKPGTTDVPWSKADQDERDAWLEEASEVVRMATGAAPGPGAGTIEEAAKAACAAHLEAMFGPEPEVDPDWFQSLHPSSREPWFAVARAVVAVIERRFIEGAR